MARPSTRHVSVRHSILMLLTIMTANASPNHGLNLHHRQAETCSSSSQKCSGAGLRDDFCCSSSSTCISIDSGSSVICCPEGQNCTYIQPITCDVSKQDPSLHPDNVIKTTRLQDSLPTCGNACCPFGYTCQGKFCSMDDTASTASMGTTTSTATESSTTSTAEATTDSALPIPIAGDLSTITVGDSTTSTTLPTSTLSQYSAASSETLSEAETSCSAYPTNAVLAGFFPGAVFGAVAASVLAVCFRRHRRDNFPLSEKVSQSTFRKSTGTLIGISDPIPSDESSFRTDFLLSKTAKRNSDGSRSVIQRSRSRVKSLFSAGAKPNATPAEDIPAVPPVPVVLSLPRTPCQRQPSTESIRVYTPPGVFTNTERTNTERPNTTLTEILDQAQAQMQAESVPTSSANSTTNSTATNNTPQRFLLPPPQKFGRRKQLPY